MESKSLGNLKDKMLSLYIDPTSFSLAKLKTPSVPTLGVNISPAFNIFVKLEGLT